ncbi:MAG: hypothetical protein GVY35_15360 [Bacteroidetes bacterium]|jgi:hypothetical protein|nr:hypothetical protein [Bacteroidota bacterium]
MSKTLRERSTEMSGLPSHTGRHEAALTPSALSQQAEAIRHYRRALAALEAGRLSGLGAEKRRRLVDRHAAPARRARSRR